MTLNEASTSNNFQHTYTGMQAFEDTLRTAHTQNEILGT